MTKDRYSVPHELTHCIMNSSISDTGVGIKSNVCPFLDDIPIMPLNLGIRYITASCNSTSHVTISTRTSLGSTRSKMTLNNPKRGGG